jgi:hypothetical protein
MFFMSGRRISRFPASVYRDSRISGGIFDSGVKTTAETARPSRMPAGKKNFLPNAHDFQDLEAFCAFFADFLAFLFGDPFLPGRRASVILSSCKGVPGAAETGSEVEMRKVTSPAYPGVCNVHRPVLTESMSLDQYQARRNITYRRMQFHGQILQSLTQLVLQCGQIQAQTVP